MKELIEFMARSIVDNPDAVVVSEEDADDHIVYHLKVADGDMGRVIGKQGRVANAMRTLLKVAAIRQGARAVLEIGDDARRDDRGGGRDYDRRDDDYDDDRRDDDDQGYGDDQGDYDSGDQGQDDDGRDDYQADDEVDQGDGRDDAEDNEGQPDEDEDRDDED
jgi:predicted RNA-binding protein YlqC (UPF0109 family)